MSRGRDTAPIMQDILDLPSVRPKSKWIPISERLPEEDGRYLTYIVNNRLSYMMICDYIQQTWCPDDQTASNNVTHWMPLPNEPYKEESEE
jgi:hypothetical protein